MLEKALASAADAVGLDVFGFLAGLDKVKNASRVRLDMLSSRYHPENRVAACNCGSNTRVRDLTSYAILEHLRISASLPCPHQSVADRQCRGKYHI